MLTKLFFNRQFMRFLLVGGFAALINFLSRIMLSQYVSFRWAVVLAYLVGMLTAYSLSKYLVFEKSGKSALHEMYRFTIVNLVAVAQVWVISVVLVEYVFPLLKFTFYAEEIGHFIGLSIPIMTSFIGHKYFTFAHTPQRRDVSSE